MSNWRTIDSAPKDEFVIITDGGWHGIYYLCPYTNNWLDDNGVGLGSLHTKSLTHWMPIPEIK